jgi:hypothetical protein
MARSVSRLGSNEQCQQLTLIFEPIKATKKCSKCKQEKDITAFRPDNKNKSGLRSICRECDKKSAKVQCRECKEKILRSEAQQTSTFLYYCKPCWEMMQGKKKCIGCKEIKDIQEFNEDKSRDDGHEYYCKECSHERYEKKQAKAILKKGKKKCVSCKKTKELSEFYPHTGARTGVANECKECYNGNKKQKKEIDKTREKVNYTISPQRAAAMLCKYGITTDDYIRMFEEQGGVCKICKRPERKERNGGSMLRIDHDHATGQVRGLLCDSCNLGLGLFDDSYEYLLNASEYLRQYQQQTG